MIYIGYLRYAKVAEERTNRKGKDLRRSKRKWNTEKVQLSDEHT
jgi:hypothetical protein